MRFMNANLASVVWGGVTSAARVAVAELGGLNTEVGMR